MIQCQNHSLFPSLFICLAGRLTDGGLMIFGGVSLLLDAWMNGLMCVVANNGMFAVF